MSTTDPITKALQDIEEPADTPVFTEPEEPTSSAMDTAEEEDAIPESDEDNDNELDDIELQVAHRDWVVEGDIAITRRNGESQIRHFKGEYVQKPLSFTAMLQFTGLIGERLSQAMSGADGLTVDGVLGESDGLVVAGRNVFSREDFSSIDSFVKGLAKLAQYVPAVVEDCQCIWLRVPFAERPIVKEIWSRSPSDGGLSLQDGQDMLETFLDQNYKEVEDFFVVRLPLLQKRVSRLRALKDGDSRRSKPSKPTAAPTQNP